MSELLGGARIVPVVVIEDPALAAPLGDALLAGGLACAEVTLRTPNALAALRELAADERLLVGAGTVINAGQAEQAVEAGAKFVVSPGFSPSVVRRCQELGVPVLPGVATSTELMAALDAGVDTVKFFPAQSLGGVPMLKALAAPFVGARFVPTGGITAELLADYLAVPAVAAVGGSWMVAPALLKQKKFDEITALTAAAVALAAGEGAGHAAA
jgi:2-dehydro-3-deoxyphosphogluconate aldolase / (4S)-4-hydroxy-2-oxoglutarate aldolase